MKRLHTYHVKWLQSLSACVFVHPVISEVMTTVHTKCSLSPREQEWLVGYPPKSISKDLLQGDLSGAGIQSGDSITIRACTNPAPTTTATTATSTNTGASSSKLVRKVIADDNSCLFNAVGYSLDKREDGASLLRQVVASIVISSPSEFPPVMLDGKSAEQYATYISQPQTWGGSVELAVLSGYYHTEIAAVDVQSTNIYIYGEGKGFSKRAYLAYSGIHYDCLVGERDNSTIWSPTDETVYEAAKAFAIEAQKAGLFTNTRTYSLRCGICQTAIVGNKEATEHARQTGHTAFEEYRG